MFHRLNINYSIRSRVRTKKVETNKWPTNEYNSFNNFFSVFLEGTKLKEEKETKIRINSSFVVRCSLWYEERTSKRGQGRTTNAMKHQFINALVDHLTYTRDKICSHSTNGHFSIWRFFFSGKLVASHQLPKPYAIANVPKLVWINRLMNGNNENAGERKNDLIKLMKILFQEWKKLVLLKQAKSKTIFRKLSFCSHSRVNYV